MAKSLPPKRNFAFPEADMLFDIYVEGVKVRNGHDGNSGHVAMHVKEDVEIDLEIKPHDPRTPVEAVYGFDGLEPFVDDAAIEAQLKQEEASRLLAAREQAQKAAEKKLQDKRTERFAAAQKSTTMQSGGVIPKPTPPK